MAPSRFPLTKEQEEVKQYLLAIMEANDRLKAEGLAEGRTEGLAEGRAEGRADGKQEALFVLLEARGLSVSDEERAAIKRCQDPQMLDAWIAKAATASSVHEVLAAKSRTVKSRAAKSRTTKPRGTKPRSTSSTRSAQRA